MFKMPAKRALLVYLWISAAFFFGIHIGKNCKYFYNKHIKARHIVILLLWTFVTTKIKIKYTYTFFLHSCNQTTAFLLFLYLTESTHLVTFFLIDSQQITQLHRQLISVSPFNVNHASDNGFLPCAWQCNYFWDWVKTMSCHHQLRTSIE